MEHELNYRSGAEVLQGKRVQAGEDAQALLLWISEEKLSGPKVDLLKRVFNEYYHLEEGKVVPEKTLLAKSVQNPHDPDASFRAKQEKKWVGYGVQVAETVPEEPKATEFITAMATQTAVGSDEAGMDQVLADQAAMGFEKPQELYVDGAYISAEVLAFQEKMKKRAGIEAAISEIVRAYAARRSRYRGLAKVRLQNYFIGAACNVHRWLRRLILQLFKYFCILQSPLAYAL